MVQVLNIDPLRERLRGMAEREGADVVVGCTQSYAIYVHENLAAKHNVGQAKFLETAARTKSGEVRDAIARVMRNRAGTLQQALLVGGLVIQRESQDLTPVDTSALKASHFTCPARDLERVSGEAYVKSEGLRISGKTAQAAITKAQLQQVRKQQRETWLKRRGKR